MIVTQHPTSIHTIFNPCLIVFQKSIEETGKAEINVSFGYDLHPEVYVTLQHEFFNEQAIFDIRKLLRDNLKKTITEIDDSPCWIDENLFLHYCVWDSEMTLIYEATAVNAVVQIGQSSDLTGLQGKFLTKLKSIRNFTTVQKQISILGFSEENTLLKFDDENVFKTNQIHFNCYIPSTVNTLKLHKAIIPELYNRDGFGWTININETYTADDNNLRPLQTKDITPESDRSYRVQFDAYVESEGSYLLELNTGTTVWQIPIINGQMNHVFTVPSVATTFVLRMFGTSATSGYCEISNFLLYKNTDSDTISLLQQTQPENPFFIRWVNQMGGYDQYMFGYRQFFNNAIESNQSVNSFILDQETASGTDETIMIEANEYVRVGAQGLTPDEFETLRKIPYSPKIEHYNSETQSWERITISKGDSDRDSRNILSEIELIFKLPQPQLQF